MPRILGFKEIDGEMYVRLDITKESSPVHLYTDDEYQAARVRLIEECAQAARQVDRTGHEWVKNSLWDNIMARAATAVRALK
jgi:hypothetical protein